MIKLLPSIWLLLVFILVVCPATGEWAYRRHDRFTATSYCQAMKDGLKVYLWGAVALSLAALAIWSIVVIVHTAEW